MLEHLICTDCARLRETGNICERFLAIIDEKDELDELIELLRLRCVSHSLDVK